MLVPVAALRHELKLLNPIDAGRPDLAEEPCFVADRPAKEIDQIGTRESVAQGPSVPTTDADLNPLTVAADSPAGEEDRGPAGGLSQARRIQISSEAIRLGDRTIDR